MDNVGAALVGGAGVVPGKNIGSQFAIFEPVSFVNTCWSKKVSRMVNGKQLGILFICLVISYYAGLLEMWLQLYKVIGKEVSQCYVFINNFYCNFCCSKVALKLSWS